MEIEAYLPNRGNIKPSGKIQLNPTVISDKEKMAYTFQGLNYRALVSNKFVFNGRYTVELTKRRIDIRIRKSSYRDTETIEQAYGIYPLTRPLHTKIKSNQNWKHYL